jgi:hypothetical protein
LSFNLLTVYINSLREFCLGILGMHILYFNKINPQLFTLSLSPCSLILQQLTVHYVMLYSYIYIYIPYINGMFQYFSFFTFSFPLLFLVLTSDVCCFLKPFFFWNLYSFYLFIYWQHGGWNSHLLGRCSYCLSHSTSPFTNS